MKQQLCDPNRLSSFVRGELSNEDELELTTHLDDCESCGRALEHQVAEASAWREASTFLGDRSFQEQEADLSVGELRESQIQHVVSQLSPTDDPNSLGRIGGYEVTGVIGSGGMGVVLKAHDRSLDRVIAVKVMAPHLAASGSARKRFAREAKAAAAVLHPNVIAIHGVSNEQTLPYLVMPYVRGASLQKRIDAEGPLPLVDILRIGAQVAAGLAAAHEQGLVHRDIKPGNILLEQGVERVTITDFGLARAVDDASMTRSGVIAGTPQYMSPEQARGEPIDARSDLFSLGSLLYSMCTGHSPFRAETSFGVIHRITQDSPRPITEINPEIPLWMEGIVMKLLSRRVEDRFQSSGEVADLLEGCLSHTQHPASTPLPMPAAELARRNAFTESQGGFRYPGIARWIGAAFASLFLCAGILLVLEWNKGTLRIESEADDVPIRIVHGKEVVKKLVVSKSGESVRIAAGNYEVEIGGRVDGLFLDNGSVTLQRGGNDIVRIVKVAPAANVLGDWPYGRLMKDLRATTPPGGVPVIPSGSPVSVAVGDELTRRLEAAPEGELDKWVDRLERITGDRLEGDLARQACRTYIVNRMSILFDDGSWNAKNAGRLFQRLQSQTTTEVEAWKNSIEGVLKDTIGQNDKEVFDGGPSYAVPLVLICVDALFDDKLSPSSSVESTVPGKTDATVGLVAAVKYRNRLGQLTPRDILAWRSTVDGFGGTRLDAAINIVLLDDYFDDGTFQRGDFEATLASTGDIADEPVVRSSNSPRQKTVDNLTRIAGALHRYHELHGHFPAATISGRDGKGGPPHSWRVELLPLLGHQALYDQYNFNASWDSQRNHLLLAKMPDVYRSPLDKVNSTFTSCFGVISHPATRRAAALLRMRSRRKSELEPGEDTYVSETRNGGSQPQLEQYTPEATVFRKQRGASFIDMHDGTSNCIAVIEAKRDIPWTKPEDIEYAADQPLPPFGGWFAEGVHAVFADGVVKFLANDNEEQTIRNLLTIADGMPAEPLLVRRLRIHGAVVVPVGEEEVVVGPETYQVQGGPLLRILTDQKSLFTEADLVEVDSKTDPNNPSTGDIVTITLTEEAGRRFFDATTKLSEQDEGGYLAIVFDRQVLSAPRVHGPIGNKLTITGNIDAKDLVERIRLAMAEFEAEGVPHSTSFEHLNAVPMEQGSPEKKLNRRPDARSVVESYIAAALARDIGKASALAKGSPGDPKNIADVPEFLNVQRLKIQTVYVDSPANPARALATSKAVRLDEDHEQPGGDRDGFLVLTLELIEDAWLVTDVDFESASDAEKEQERFLEANPNSIGLP